jgi:uncharacterized protein (TIGR00661 family)
MARLIYGVSGEGSGHSSRAREMIAHLESRGHTVKVASYDRGYRNLSPDFDVLEIEGLHIASVENKVSVVETFVDNLGRLSEGIRALGELRALFRGFEPDCVITDFEPMTAYLATHYDLPLITLDNQHRIRYMRYPCPPHLKRDAMVTETVIRAMVPRPDISLVTTFYFGELANDRTFLFPPILRSQVLAREPEEGERILVYCTQAFESILRRLRRFPRERFVVYGFDRSGSDGNLEFKPFSSDGFLSDLARAKAVVATAGFTLITESLHLGKPYLALPMRGQFEQELNAILLAELGCGKNGRKPTNDTIGEFLYRLPEYREALGRYDAREELDIRAKLDELLAHDCALARRHHHRRGEGGGAA